MGRELPLFAAKEGAMKARSLGIAFSTGAVAVFLAACGGSQPPIVTPGAMPQGHPVAARAGRLYVANENIDSVTVYALGVTGNVKPLEEIRGSITGIGHPHDVAVDASGNVYVANAYPASVTVYASGASGNVKPIATIGGSNTELRLPTGIAVDSKNGRIYVSNISGGRSGKGSVTIYPSGSKGNVSPLGIIQGAKTRLDHPNCLALDASGNIAVTNAYGYVTFYAAGSKGDVAPRRTVQGALTDIKLPTQVTVDSSLKTYVANFDNNSLTAYAAGADGNVFPIRDIHGSQTNLRLPLGIAVDAAGNIYAASGIGKESSITVYASGASGNVRPIERIEGALTGLDDPHGIAIR
jgi:hypothetical protein